MELLLVRHAQNQKLTGAVRDFDGSLTEVGMKQACLTSAWLRYNFVLNGFVGFTSPYLRSLQTASTVSEICDVEFTVDDSIREFRFNPADYRDGVVLVKNRSVLFENITWPKDWNEDKYFTHETVDEFVDRCESFLYKLEEKKYNKAMVITHGATSIVLAQLALGKKTAEIKRICLGTQGYLNAPAKEPTTEEFIFLTGMKHCGMTLIRESEPIWFSKVVYEQTV